MKNGEAPLLLRSEREKTKEPIRLKPWPSLTRLDDVAHAVIWMKQDEVRDALVEHDIL